MEVSKQCASLKEKVTQDLQSTTLTSARLHILIQAFYQLSRDIIPLLGYPSRSQGYLAMQDEVLALVSCLALPLLKEPLPDGRAIEVLIEVAEGCHDPLLKKKLTVYAQELLLKRHSSTAAPPRLARSWLLLGAGALCLTVIVMRLPHWPLKRHQSPVAPTAVPAPAAEVHPAPVAVTVPAADRRGPDETPSGVAAPSGEVTKVRVVNNQVLVPVTLYNAGETVSLEMVLDTGASRTAIHEEFAAPLHVDLQNARGVRTEVADGRVIHSRIARVDSLAVGPFSVSSMEVEFFPYHGTLGVHGGLLGMDFLGKHRYQLDLEKGQIHWL